MLLERKSKFGALSVVGIHYGNLTFSEKNVDSQHILEFWF